MEIPFELTVPVALEAPHPVISSAIKALRKMKPDRDGLVTARGLRISVGVSQVERALRFVDTLLKGIERAGHKVEHSKELPERTRLVVDGVAIEFGLRERLVRGPHVPVKGEFFAPKWDYQPSGDLRFKIEGEGPWGIEHQWEETSRMRLEAHINQVFQSILQLPETRRAREAERAAREQLRQQAEDRRRQEEARRAEVQRRANAIVAAAHRWDEARLVREFVEVTRSKLADRLGKLVPGGPADNWLTFAGEVAARLDPSPELLAALGAGKADVAQSRSTKETSIDTE